MASVIGFLVWPGDRVSGRSSWFGSWERRNWSRSVRLCS